jgi:hypothetical protein
LRPKHTPWGKVEPTGLPVLALRLRAADSSVLSFFSAFTSFGTPLDITLASLKVDHLFPADEATRRALVGASASRPEAVQREAGMARRWLPQSRNRSTAWKRRLVQ